MIFSRCYKSRPFSPESQLLNIDQHGTGEKVLLPDNCKQHNFNHRPKANTGTDTAVKKTLQSGQMQPRQLEDDDKASGVGHHTEQPSQPSRPDWPAVPVVGSL